jgi:hypothetical protein
MPFNFGDTSRVSFDETRRSVDKFVEFNYLLLKTSPIGGQDAVAERSLCRERVDVIARQFRDFLKKRVTADQQPQGVMMTHDFKVRGQATSASGWLSFHVDRGDGTVESLEEVAIVVFAREADEEIRRVLQDVAPGQEYPATPFAVGVLLKQNVPSIVSEFITKTAAGFFSEEL